MAEKLNQKYRQQMQAERQKQLNRSIDAQLYQRFKSHRSHVAKAVLIALAIIVFCFAQVLMRETKLVEQRYRNSKLNEEIRELKLANDSKREALAKLFDVKTLTEKAQDIGLEKPNLEQIIRIPVPQINQLSVKLQSADAEGLKNDESNIDYNLIYKNLAEYYEKMNREHGMGKQVAEQAVTYGQQNSGGDALLLREPGSPDKEFLKRQAENAAKAEAAAQNVAKEAQAAEAAKQQANGADSTAANANDALNSETNETQADENEAATEANSDSASTQNDAETVEDASATGVTN